MVNLDVLSVFLRVPTNETLTVAKDNLVADPSLEERSCIPTDNLMEMLTFFEETIYFGVGCNIYRQEEGLAMGSPLSPLLCNVYMEYFEEMALGSKSLKPSLCLKFGDDTFIISHYQENDRTLLDHVNSIRPSIQFILEKKTKPQIILSDVLITGTVPGFKSFVYRKSFLLNKSYPPNANEEKLQKTPEELNPTKKKKTQL